MNGNPGVSDTNGQGAAYAIHIAGVVGPMLVSSLTAAGSLQSVPWDVRTEDSSTIVVSVTEDDLVEVVRRLADEGVEIEWVRELGTSDGSDDRPG